MTAYSYTRSTGKKAVARSTFGKDREKAVRGVARNLTVDEWASCKRQYQSGNHHIQAPRGYTLTRSEVKAIAAMFRDTL